MGYGELAVGDFVHRGELLRSGVGDERIRRLVATGDLVRVRRGSYAGVVADRAIVDYVRRVRAVADRSPQYVVGGLSAAALHGAPIWDADLSEVTLLRPTVTGSSRSAGRRVRSGVLAARDIQDLGGVAVTTPARTMIDVARWCSFATAVVACDGMIRLAPTQFPTEKQMEALRRRVGVAQARLALAAVDARSESPGETLLRLLLIRGGLPAPQLQVDVLAVDGSLIGRCDLGWVEHAAMVEFDGRLKYRTGGPSGRTPDEVLFAEKVREDQLRAAGVSIVRVVWSDLSDPSATVARVREAIRLGDRARAAGLVTARFRPAPGR